MTVNEDSGTFLATEDGIDAYGVSIGVGKLNMHNANDYAVTVTITAADPTAKDGAKTYKEDANVSADIAKAYAETGTYRENGVMKRVTSAKTYAENAGSKADAAESWAVGGTGTRTGEDTNNAKYWAEQAQAAGGGSDVFYAQYGVTTSQEIEAAYRAGKAVFCKATTYILPLSYRGSTTKHSFFNTDDIGEMACVCVNSVWSQEYTDFLPTGGGTMTGSLTLSGDPTAALQAATKQYVDSAIGAAIGGSY